MQEIENIGEFNFAQTVEEKRIILEKLISDNQISEEDIKELQSQINDIIGIVTLKRKNIFSNDFEFSDYFIRFV